MYATNSRSIARALGRPGAGRAGKVCSLGGNFNNGGCLSPPLLRTRHHHYYYYGTQAATPTVPHTLTSSSSSSSSPPQPALPIRKTSPGPTVARNNNSDGASSTPLPQRNVAILGGGLTGLSAAWYLARAMPQAKITLYEASGRLGGWIDTEKVDVARPDGSTARVYIERAARMVKPLTSGGRVPRWNDVVFFDLVAKLGLADQLECSLKEDETVAGFLYYPDHLVAIPVPPRLKTPGDLVRKAPTLFRMAKMLFEPVFKGSLAAVWHALSTRPGPIGTRTFYGDDDISIGDYYAQRYGTPEVVDKVLSAIMHGTAGGDVWKLSMAASPLADTLAPGDFTRAARKKAGQRSTDGDKHDHNDDETALGFALVRKDDVKMMGEHLKDRETFDLATKHLGSSSVWFRNGFSTLTDALAKALAEMPNVTIRLNDPATQVKYDGNSDQVQLTTKQNQQPVAYDKVISTILAKDLVRITGDTLPSLASETAVTIMVVNLWYPDPHLNFPNNGFGYLIPQAISFNQNPELVLGVIFDSDREFPIPTPSNPSPAPRGADSVQGTKLTVLMGGHYWDDLPASAVPDAETAIGLAKRAVARHLRLSDDVASSAHGWAKLCRDCLPQQLVGHRGRMRAAHFEMRGAFAGRLAVAGGSYQAPGVLGALRAGRDIGLQVADAARAREEGGGGGAQQEQQEQQEQQQQKKRIASAASVGDTGLMRFETRHKFLVGPKSRMPLRYGSGAWVDGQGELRMRSEVGEGEGAEEGEEVGGR